MSSEIQGLHNLVAPIGARRKPIRVGRGESSGKGKTCGRGTKGQKARKSGQVRPGFEGGQLPLARRLPKRGFSNYLFRKHFTAINVGRLSECFGAGETVEMATMLAVGLVSKTSAKVKILGVGDVGHALHLKVERISAGARSKIEAAGGSVEILEAALKSSSKSKEIETAGKE